jgi:hypothetical protein
LFEKNFIKFSLDESIDTYINKINKILNKKNSKPLEKASFNEKKENFKSKKETQSLSSNQSTFKSLKKGTSKIMYRKPLKIDEDKPCIMNNSQKNINKNIFMFLSDEKER